MMDCDNRPLVSLVLRSHNQRMYFCDALKGAFAQDYTPLEIVVYDDASTDGSDEMIRQMVCEYKRTNNQHKIVYEHGVRNIGNIRSAEAAYSMAHGELCIQNDGDDISLPNRVSCTVKAWIASGKKSKLIHCGAWKFDDKGVFGEVERLSAFHPKGACVAYSRDVYSAFPPVAQTDAYDDWPYPWRARLLGEEMYIPDKLVLYRVDAGDSTNINSKKRVRSIQHTVAGLEQVVIDIESMMAACPNDANKYHEMYLEANKIRAEFRRMLFWLSAKTVGERWRNRPYGLNRVFKYLRSVFCGHLGNLVPIVQMALVLVPFRLGFALLDIFNSTYERFSRNYSIRFDKGDVNYDGILRKFHG